jgi:hypothetical protein
MAINSRENCSYCTGVGAVWILSPSPGGEDISDWGSVAQEKTQKQENFAHFSHDTHYYLKFIYAADSAPWYRKDGDPRSTSARTSTGSAAGPTAARKNNTQTSAEE